MDGIEKIRVKVLEETKEKVADIIQKAEADVDQIMAANMLEIEALNEEINKEMKLYEKERSQRTSAISALDERRIILQAKQKLLEEVLQESLGFLVSMQEIERKNLYLRWLEDMISGEETCEVIFNHKDQMIAHKIAEHFPKQIKISAKEGDFQGGFILQKGKIIEDYSFEAIYMNNHDLLAQVAADILFNQTEQEA